MATLFRYGGLAVGLALLFAPAWLFDSYMAVGSPERGERVLAYRVHGIGLGQTVPDLARRFNGMQISLMPGRPGVPPSVSGFVVTEGQLQNGDSPVNRHDYSMSFTGPAAGLRLYSLVANEIRVSGSRVAEAIRSARRSMGREASFSSFTDRRHFMLRHVRTYRWGRRGRITYSLYVERIDPTDGTAELHLLHILYDNRVFQDTDGQTPGSSQDARSADPTTGDPSTGE